MPIRITAAVPFHRDKLFLSACLDALAAQTRPPDEILLVADGGGDGSAELAKAWVRRSTAVPARLLEHGTRRGLLAARNTALNDAKGDWVALVAPEVLLSADWLERLEEELKGDPGISGLGGRILEAHRTAPADAWRALHLPRHWGEAAHDAPELHASAVLYRREHLLAAGGYDVELDAPGADLALATKLGEQGRRLRYAPQALAYGQRKDSPFTVSEEAWARMKAGPEQAGVYGQFIRYGQYLPYEGQDALRHIAQDREAGNPWPTLRISLSLLPFLLLKDLDLLERKGALEPAAALDSGLGLASLTKAVWARIGLKNAPGPELWPELDRQAPSLTGGFDEAGFQELCARLPKGEPLVWKQFIKAWTDCLNAALEAPGGRFKG